MWKAACELREWTEITEARNGELVFIAFRMMTPLNSYPTLLHLLLFPMFFGTGKTAVLKMNERPLRQRREQWSGGIKETSRAGGGRNTLASYSACHSNWQHQPALLVAVGPHRASPSLQQDLCLTLWRQRDLEHLAHLVDYISLWLNKTNTCKQSNLYMMKGLGMKTIPS